MKKKYISHKKRFYGLILRFSKGEKLKKISLKVLAECGFLSNELMLTDKANNFLKEYHLTKEEKELLRFWEKVEKTETCWNWKAHKLKKGYGHFHSKGKEILAHRYSYELHKGKIPENLFVLHSCDNPSCVNPEHLWLGTKKDNRTDCESKGRAKYFGSKEAKKGIENVNAKLDEKNVLKIRELKNKISHSKIATKFSINRLTVQQILYRRTWKNI